MSATRSTDDRPVGELFQQLSTQTATLVRQEIKLAQLELQEKGKRAGLGAGMFGGAGVVALYGGGALVAAAVLALATALEQHQQGPAQPANPDPDELRREIEQTRAELGATVEALSHKADVKGQVREKRDEVKDRLRGATPQQAQQAAGQAAQKAKQRPLPLAALGALVAGFVLGRLTAGE
jgi:hypothetical protein